ncbi:MAG: class I SAM-dependent methyltransferase [Anaerolineales bacterium]
MASNFLNKTFWLYKINFGYCPVCERRTLFIALESWLRDKYLCARCESIPRYRAIINVLQTHFPAWRNLKIHESSPGGASSAKIARECSSYIGSHFFPETPLGATKNGFQCENLESQTFDDERFDLVITQDVFEHVLNPAKAFREIARTLKPGGAHLFTVPWYYWQKTRIRAMEKDGKIEHLLQPEYHGNPISADGSLVITEWGYDMPDFIYRNSDLSTTVVRIHDPYQGIVAKFIEVFISYKPQRDIP